MTVRSNCLLGATIVPLDKRLSRRDNRFLQVVEGGRDSGTYVTELASLRDRKRASVRSLNKGDNEITRIELRLEQRLLRDKDQHALRNLLRRNVLA